MLLERLTVQDLREDVRRVLLGPEVLNCNQSGAAHLPQLKQFTIDVARMLRRTEAMAKVVCSLVVGLHTHFIITLVPDELQQLHDVDQLDGASC